MRDLESKSSNLKRGNSVQDVAPAAQGVKKGMLTGELSEVTPMGVAAGSVPPPPSGLVAELKVRPILQPNLDVALNKLIEQGLTFSDCVSAFSAQQGSLEAAYIDAAKMQVEEGQLEVDDGAIVSIGEDPGAFVMAWLFVGADEAGVEPGDAEEAPHEGANVSNTPPVNEPPAPLESSPIVNQVAVPRELLQDIEHALAWAAEEAKDAAKYSELKEDRESLEAQAGGFEESLARLQGWLSRSPVQPMDRDKI